MPEKFSGFNIESAKSPSEHKVFFGIFEIVSFPNTPRPTTVTITSSFKGFLMFFSADKSIKHTITFRHPFPNFSITKICRGNNFFNNVTSFCIKKFARFIISEQNIFRSSNHSVSMNHKSFTNFSSPKFYSIIIIKTN